MVKEAVLLSLSELESLRKNWPVSLLMGCGTPSHSHYLLLSHWRLLTVATIQPSSQASSTSQGTITNVPAVTLIAAIITAIVISALAAIMLRRKRSSRP